MQDRPTYRLVYKGLHRPPTICGVDRRLFFLSLFIGAATLNPFLSFFARPPVFLGLYVFGLWAAKRDPQMLRILLSSARFKARYDAIKHTRTDVERSGDIA